MNKTKKILNKISQNKNNKYYVQKKLITEMQECFNIIQSEVSQKEKHQYSIQTHIYGI